MQISLLLYIYLLNAAIVAFILLVSFWSDSSTPKNHKLSWLIVLVASLLWFIAIPLSIVEFSYKSLRRQRALKGQANPSKNLS